MRRGRSYGGNYRHVGVRCRGCERGCRESLQGKGITNASDLRSSAPVALQLFRDFSVHSVVDGY